MAGVKHDTNSGSRITTEVVERLLAEDKRKGKPGGSGGGGLRRRKQRNAKRVEQEEFPGFGDDSETVTTERVAPKRSHLKVRITLGQRAYLLRLAQEQGMTITDVVNSALNQFIHDYTTAEAEATAKALAAAEERNRPAET